MQYQDTRQKWNKTNNCQLIEQMNILIKEVINRMIGVRYKKFNNNKIVVEFRNKNVLHRTMIVIMILWLKWRSRNKWKNMINLSKLVKLKKNNKKILSNKKYGNNCLAKSKTHRYNLIINNQNNLITCRRNKDRIMILINYQIPLV